MTMMTDSEQRFVDSILSNSELHAICSSDESIARLASIILCSTEWLDISRTEDILSNNSVRLSLSGLHAVWNHIRPESKVNTPMPSGWMGNWYANTITDWTISDVRRIFNSRLHMLTGIMDAMRTSGYKIIE